MLPSTVATAKNNTVPRGHPVRDAIENSPGLHATPPARSLPLSSRPRIGQWPITCYFFGRELRRRPTGRDPRRALAGVRRRLRFPLEKAMRTGVLAVEPAGGMVCRTASCETSTTRPSSPTPVARLHPRDLGPLSGDDIATSNASGLPRPGRSWPAWCRADHDQGRDEPGPGAGTRSVAACSWVGCVPGSATPMLCATSPRTSRRSWA